MPAAAARVPTTAQGGSGFCNRHGGGSRCEIPECNTNTSRNKRCKRHQLHPMPTTGPGPATAASPTVSRPNIRTVIHDLRQATSELLVAEARLQLAHTVHELRALTKKSRAHLEPTCMWVEIGAVLERAGSHPQPANKDIRLCNTPRCRLPAATADN